MSDNLSATYQALADQFTDRFRPVIQHPRIIGREAEYPVVTGEGKAADVRRLWSPLLEAGDLTPVYGYAGAGREEMMVGLKGAEYNYMLEVGLGTVEINSRPCDDLFTLQASHEQSVARLVRAAARFGWRVLGYGIQPVTKPSLPIMAPKQRYFSLYRAMGAEWLWYTVTASDQIQIDISRDEMVQMLNFGNLMTPILIALCANSPVYAGQLSPFCSAREGQMARIHASEFRHGMLARPVRDIGDFVAMMSQSVHLIQRDADFAIPGSKPFTDYLAQHGPDLDAFLFHEHYIWNSARLRAAYSTIELRPACQQPWNEHMAAMALSLGLIEAATQIQSYIEATIGDGFWEIMRTYHRYAIERGLRAPQPAPISWRKLSNWPRKACAPRLWGRAPARSDPQPTLSAGKPGATHPPHLSDRRHDASARPHHHPPPPDRNPRLAP
ncbi:MAG: hypothetical protein HC802_00325 [Caldilineaceae bacterium]|nr:hypothetical protein [Caldilineaceae bacterium]